MSSVYVTETSTITSNCGPRTRMAGLTGRHDNTAPELQLNKAKRPTVSALQVVPASQNTNQTQLPELGYEVTRSGPTTNFVGNHMTQGAIDLVQAELNDFLPSQPLLLQDKPQAGPTYIATRQPATRTPMTQLINSYSWWDAGAHVCLSIPIPATYLGCTAEICAQRQAVRITFQSASADKEAVHTLSIDPLYAEIRPEASACTVEEMPVSDKHGETCRPDKASLPKKFMQAIADGIDSHVASPEQPSKDGPRQSLPSVTLKIQQASDHSTDIGLVSHQPTSVTDIVAAHDKHSTRILVTLVKLNTREPWLTLTGLKPAQQHKVPRPPNAADMAALRRTLITQRQQRQCSQAHPQATKQAVLEDASSSLSQSLIDDQPDNAAIDTTMKQQKLAASNSCETKQHPPLDGQAHQAALQKLESEAHLKASQGAYAEACALYREAVCQMEACCQATPADQMAHTYSGLASCFMQIGHHRQAVEVCNKAIALDGLEGKQKTCIQLLHMRALAFEELEIFAYGLADHELILRLDPTDQKAQHAACRLRGAIKSISRNFLA